MSTTVRKNQRQPHGVAIAITYTKLLLSLRMLHDNLLALVPARHFFWGGEPVLIYSGVPMVKLGVSLDDLNKAIEETVQGKNLSQPFTSMDALLENLLA